MRRTECGSFLLALCILWPANALNATVSVGEAPRGGNPAELRIPERVDFDASQSVGVFIGVRSFPKSLTLEAADPIAEVPFAVDDAIDLAHLFAFELELVAASRVNLLLSGSPVKAASADRLKRLEQAHAKTLDAGLSEVYVRLQRSIDSVGSSGVLVVAAATHGFAATSGQYLLAADSAVSFAEETGVFIERVLGMAADSRSTRRILLIDACRRELTRGARGVGDPRSAASQELREAIGRAEGEVVLFAARRNGYAYDDHVRKNGVFTGAVLEGLKCAAATDAEGLVTAKLLATHVNSAVESWARDHGKPGPFGIEYQLGGAGADLPLALCRPNPGSGPGQGQSRFLSPPESPVTPGTMLEIGGEIASFCSGGLWLAFERGGRIWPRLEIKGRVFQKRIAVPSDFRGGRLVLACVPPRSSERFRVWLRTNYTVPLSKPDDFTVLQEAVVELLFRDQED